MKLKSLLYSTIAFAFTLTISSSMLAQGPIASFEIDGQIVSVTQKAADEAKQKGEAFIADTNSSTGGGAASLSEIQSLAKHLGLFDEIEPNLHLSFLSGDIAYWSEQNLSLKRVELEFRARRLVLDAAKKSGVVIPTQGDLSFYAQRLIPSLLKSRN